MQFSILISWLSHTDRSHGLAWWHRDRTFRALRRVPHVVRRCCWFCCHRVYAVVVRFTPCHLPAPDHTSCVVAREVSVCRTSMLRQLWRVCCPCGGVAVLECHRLCCVSCVSSVCASLAMPPKLTVPCACVLCLRCPDMRFCARQQLPLLRLASRTVWCSLTRRSAH